MDPLERVTEHVMRIPLPLPIPDLSHVNCYAVIGETGRLTLVDPGWASADTERALQAALLLLGSSTDHVDRILVTHSHWDHFTQAIAWQRRHGIPVLLGRGEKPTVDAFSTIEHGGSYPAQAAMLRRAGAASMARKIEAHELEPFEREVPYGDPDSWVDDGDLVDCDGRPVEVIATPGHTRGHSVFHELTDNLLFTGDHVLPRITPSVSFEREPERLPLASYLTSLRTLLARPDARMLPAHGAVTESVHERVQALLEHHRERLDVIADRVASGASTAADVARTMTWTRHARSVDDLGLVHGMTAILETNVHLELLAYQGVLVRTVADDGVEHFSVAA